MHSALLIADYLIAHGHGTLTPLQVIKMVYISHGFSLALLNRPLFLDEVEAWKYGPVVPSVYSMLKRYGGSPVPALSYCSTNVRADDILERKRFFENVISSDMRDILDKIISLYGRLTGIDLLKLTHKKGSPWSQYYKKGQGVVIPNQVIKRHYETLVSDASPT